MLNFARPMKILGTGKYLPIRRVYSEELDLQFDRPKGWVREKTSIDFRCFAGPEETSVFMATQALLQALEASGCSAKDLDLIVSACSMAEQPIPCNAVLIQKSLGLEQSGIPCFDVNSTCLSFLTALDIASRFLVQGEFNRIAVVSSELPSKGVDWNHIESSTLFGDGAAAAILGTDEEKGADSKILSCLMKTYSAGSTFCQIKAGGTRFNPRTPPERFEDYLFQMDGRSVYKLAAEKLPGFVSELLAQANLSLEDIDVVIPHQASALAIQHLHQRLNIPSEKLIQILGSHGNQVAASIPSALHDAIEGGHLKRGQIAMLIGTAAGLSLGGLILRY